MISIQNMSKSFNGVPVLTDINCDIEKGDIISLIGPSGTGKSTFLRCLCQLEKADSGIVTVDGVSTLGKAAGKQQALQKMGMVFQAFHLFPHLTALENIMAAPVFVYGKTKAQAQAEAMELLEMVGLGERAENYPDQLSGGQKQRVAIARALAVKPEILLFDEPTSALDPTMVNEVLVVIKNLARTGITMLIVTHEMRFAKSVSSRIFYMDEGVIYEQGTPDEIFDNPQRDKTRRFVRGIRCYHTAIKSKMFDIYAMNSAIEEFGRKQMLSQRKLDNIQATSEELLMQVIIPQLGNKIDISYTLEANDSDEAFMYIEFGDIQANPLESPDAELPLKLIQRYSRSLEYLPDNGRSMIKVVI